MLLKFSTNYNYFRLRVTLEHNLRISQNRFRQNRSTLQHILVLHRLLENIGKATEESLYGLFIDFKKDFDSATWSIIAAVLKGYIVPDILVNAFMSFYFYANFKICTNDGLSDSIN